MKKIRHIKLIEDRGARQMAIDEAILNSAIKGLSGNTIRFYTWKPSAISIGFFQSMKEEIDIDIAKKSGVDVVRRYTGGGAVFHQHELTYSLVVSEKDVPSDIVESYEHICRGIILGLAELGISASFSPINDILVGVKKISGNAQTRKGGYVLQHGTILLDIDVEKMFSLLLVPNEKIKDKLIKNVKERVTSLYLESAKNYKEDFLEEIFLSSFSKALGFVSVKGELSNYELQEAEKLLKEKYENDSWNYKR